MRMRQHRQPPGRLDRMDGLLHPWPLRGHCRALSGTQPAPEGIIHILGVAACDQTLGQMKARRRAGQGEHFGDHRFAGQAFAAELGADQADPFDPQLQHLVQLGLERAAIRVEAQSHHWISRPRHSAVSSLP